MLKLVLTLLMLIPGLVASAQQVILLEQDSVFGSYVDVDIENTLTHFELDLFFKNNTQDDIRIHWRRSFSEECPDMWWILASDYNVSYPYFIDESQVAIQMSPVDSHFMLRQEIYPNLIPGCCDIMVMFYEEADLDHAIDTGYYYVQINSENCQTTSVANLSDLRVHCYPNPASSFIQFTIDVTIESIEIIAWSGYSFGKFIIPASSQVDISFLPAGIYFYKCKSPDKGIVVGRFVKL